MQVDHAAQCSVNNLARLFGTAVIETTKRELEAAFQIKARQVESAKNVEFRDFCFLKKQQHPQWSVKGDVWSVKVQRVECKV